MGALVEDGAYRLLQHTAQSETSPPSLMSNPPGRLRQISFQFPSLKVFNYSLDLGQEVSYEKQTQEMD